MNKFCSVKFLNTDRLYTYETFYTDLVNGDLVTVMANNAISVAIFIDYVEQPEFPCKLVLSFINTNERSKYDKV